MTEAAATSTPPPMPLVADRLADFGDRLPPMLVKELRQGLRAKTFVIVFLVLQVLLALVLLSAVASNSHAPQRAGEAVSKILFLFYSWSLLVIQPLRAIGTLHREVRDNTIELMVLTRLNAWKIVLGKWVSLVAQSALILTAVAPYLVLRYWLGNMNLLGELTLLVLVFLASATLTAVIAGISALPSVIIRGLIPLLAAAFLIWFIPVAIFDGWDEISSATNLGSAMSLITTAVMTAGFAYLTWFALGIGASGIAPAAENHSSWRRLVTTAALLVALVAAKFVDIGEPWFIIVLVILAPSLVLSWTEPLAPIPPLCAPFVRRGPPGKTLGRFLLYPGWPSGVFHGLLSLFLAFAVIQVGVGPSITTDDWVALISLIGSLLFPALLVAAFSRKQGQRFTLFLLLFVATTIVSVVLVILASEMAPKSRSFLWWLSWLPQTGLGMLDLGSGSGFPEERVLTVTAAINGFYLAAFTALALIRVRRWREAETTALEVDA